MDPLEQQKFLFITRATVVAAAMAFGLASAHAGERAKASAAQDSSAELRAQFNKEKADCMNGQSGQDRATCLKEANNAYAEARRGMLSDTRPRELRRNALARCASLPAEDVGDCEARARGEGHRSGSVKGGGIYKETSSIRRERPVLNGSGVYLDPLPDFLLLRMPADIWETPMVEEPASEEQK